MKNILLIEDDEQILKANMLYLKDKFNVTSATSIKEALNALNDKIDLIVLDLILPDGNGEEIFRKISNSIPIIILSTIDDYSFVCKYLENGALDYLIKPCKSSTLCAHIEARLKINNILIYKDMKINLNSREVSIKNIDLPLTTSEFNILLFLAQHEGVCFTPDKIYQEVWQQETLNLRTSVSRHISSLRKKINDISDFKYIFTEFAKGYYFISNDN